MKKEVKKSFLMKRLFVFFIVFSGMFACKALKPLTLEREDNLARPFKTTGFYFGFSRQEADSKVSYLSKVIVFYSNGVCLHFGRLRDTLTTKDDWEREWRSYFKDSLAPDHFNVVPYWWGVYHIRGDSVKLEKWISTDYYYRTLLSAGKILNNTTLLWRSGEFGKDWKNEVSYAVKDQTLSDKADTLYFAPLAQKPDSTNQWIK